MKFRKQKSHGIQMKNTMAFLSKTEKSEKADSWI